MEDTKWQSREHRIPVSTYRLQFNRGFNFRNAHEIVGYLADLGIGDFYGSPVFLAGPESTHGYDICRFDQLNPNLGTADEFTALSAELQKRGMGLLLDIVPNHMGSHPSNTWWNDVLKHGVKSKFSKFFDINWNSANPTLRGKVLLPVLGDRYGTVLQRGELRLKESNGEIVLEYYERRFPLSPETEKMIWDETKLSSSTHPLDEVFNQYNSNFERLHRLVQEQHYRLAFWRLGPAEINYRRFFDVTDLVAIRAEDPEVFQQSHVFVRDWLANGTITGLRVDHPDGLFDPKSYCDRLRGLRAPYVVVEKILSDGERLPKDWPVDGTTGYDFLIHLNALFVNSLTESLMTQIYTEFTGEISDYEEVTYNSKRYVFTHLFPAEIEALTRRLYSIASDLIDAIDFTRDELRTAIVEFVAAFQIYRTYVRPDKTDIRVEERNYIKKAVQSGIERLPELTGALQFLQRVLLLEYHSELTPDFIMRFQQVTGPVIAKGIEDTSFYRYVRLVSLNEVGGNPGQFGISAAHFHAYNRYKAAEWPYSLVTTATHDTKRGEDARARLNVLSELPDEWRSTLNKCKRVADCWRRNRDVPYPNDEYMLCQVFLATWTSQTEAHLEEYIERIEQYMVKAVREAKTRTSWTDANEEYEAGLKEFIRQALRSSEYRAAFQPLYKSVSFFGIFNSLSQLVLKVCSPGVPDFYQGTELWDLSLVDPDNRRPVNYEQRAALLAEIRDKSATALLACPEDGVIKLFITWKLLNFRKQNVELFQRGDYIEIEVEGSSKENVVAFERRIEAKSLLTIVPRLVCTLVEGKTCMPLGDTWGNTQLKLSKPYKNIITGETPASGRLSDILRTFPVAVLFSEE